MREKTARRINCQKDGEFEKVHMRNGASIPAHKTYAIDPPITMDCGQPFEKTVETEVTHLCADFCYTFDHGNETMVLPCDSNGEVRDWGDMLCVPYDAVSNDDAMRMLGYEVVE